MLQFTVIAGPNGAGKSTFSTRMSRTGALVFDPDFHKKNIETQYPDISEEAVESAVSRKYDNFEMQAIGAQKNLTVETNLRNEFLIERAAFFSGAGYDTRLVFMLLPDVESSMDRVNLRVKQKGHFVDAESIRYNFSKSMENLFKAVTGFDKVILVCAAANYGIKSQPELLLAMKQGSIITESANIPEWAAPIVNQVVKLKIDSGRTPGRKV